MNLLSYHPLNQMSLNVYGNYIIGKIGETFSLLSLKNKQLDSIEHHKSKPLFLYPIDKSWKSKNF